MGSNFNKMLGLLALVLALASTADAFWRMSCSTIQTGRLDPIVNPGAVASHVHKVSGASNFGPTNSFADLTSSKCTSCEVGDDKSAYWTPQLYYQYANGTFSPVPNGGTVVYYLGRGENRSNIEPFPPGFKMLSGDTRARSNDTTTTYSDSVKKIKGRPVSDRVSFACLDKSGPMPEQNWMFRTNCSNGMRAQIHFQSCWDGRDYQTDQSHVAYMSQIDNGYCPPTHPRQLMHLFFEVIYGVNDIKTEKNGKFVFANGDTTGFGFHGDFMNGWDVATLKSAIKDCANNDAINGQISKCPPLAKTLNPYTDTNCPERPAIVNEQVKGLLKSLPGCNPLSEGPGRAPVPSCPGQTTPTMNTVGADRNQKMWTPNINDKLPGGGWAFSGCAVDNGNPRPLNGFTSASDTAMTIDSCTATCAAKGFKFAGLEYSKQCFCGASLPNGAVGNCGTTPLMVCSGNATQWCGAPSMLNVWTNTAFTAPSVLTPGQSTVANNTGKYFGCFTESGRTLGDSSWAADGVSVTSCAKFCQDGNFALFGVEYGRECYCGNNIKPPAARVVEGDCNMACKGNASEKCGGSSRISVWNNTLYIPRRNVASVNGGQFAYLGCYTEGNKGRALGKAAGTSKSDSYSDGTGMSVEKCGTFCKARGFKYMGVEYGQECYCNNDGPTNGAAKVGDGDCNMTCKGDKTEWCGGSSRINVYKAP